MESLVLGGIAVVRSTVPQVKPDRWMRVEQYVPGKTKFPDEPTTVKVGRTPRSREERERKKKKKKKNRTPLLDPPVMQKIQGY